MLSAQNRLHAERYVVCIASLRQRLTPLSDFIQVEATSFEAKEEEARQVTPVKYKDCVQHSKMGGHLKTHGAAVPVFEKHLPWAHEPSCPLMQTSRRLGCHWGLLSQAASEQCIKVPWGDYMQFIPSRSSSTMRLTSKQSSLARRFLRAHPLSLGETL